MRNVAHELQTAWGRLLAHQNQLQSLSKELTLIEERERRKIATDLHDTIGQSLALSMIKSDALRSSFNDTEPSQAIKTIRKLLGTTLQNSRSLTLELCPPILYEVGFEAALKQLIERLHNQFGVTVQYRMDTHIHPLKEDLRYLLFRIVRELLRNVVKPAQVNRADLRIERNRDVLWIRVLDERIGFNLSPSCSVFSSQGDFGLFSIRERIKQIGGEVSIRSQCEKKNTC